MIFAKNMISRSATLSVSSSEPKKSRHRTGMMSTSEVLTILICFHLGAHRAFKHYYQQVVQCYWKDLFPVTLSYNRFVEIQSR